MRFDPFDFDFIDRFIEKHRPRENLGMSPLMAMAVLGIPASEAKDFVEFCTGAELKRGSRR